MGDHELAGYLDYARAQFPAMYALELHDWSSAAALEPPAAAKPLVQAITQWTRGVAAARLRHVAEASESVARVDALLDEASKTNEAYLVAELDIWRDQLRAWAAFAQGKSDDAVRQMRDAADRQDARGKGEVEIPAREMLADILLETGKAREALVEYEQSMTIDPNRFNTLFGAASAAEKVGQIDVARKYFTRLVENCKGSESARSELAKARRFTEEHGSAQ
jgi:tetratricopeptide (TPR) repeat protein